MSAQGTIKRYVLEIEKISSSSYPSFKELKNFLYDHDFKMAPRTLQRDIENIRNEFGIEIKYDRLKKGYFIDKEESINLDSFFRFLEIAGTANLLSESLRDGKDSMNYISFESQGNLKGVQYLKSILFAIKNHRKVSFTHLNYETGKVKNYSLKPYLLKEYQNRWYIVGLIGGMKEFRTFGIDRVEDLQVLTETFVPDSKIHPAELFENIIGLRYSTNHLEDVILSFTPLQGKYVNALPLHKSQQILKQSDMEVVVKISVIPNYELQQKIMMLGDQVKVIEPKWFVKEIKDGIKNALKKYQ